MLLMLLCAFFADPRLMYLAYISGHFLHVAEHSLSNVVLLSYFLLFIFIHKKWIHTICAFYVCNPFYPIISAVSFPFNFMPSFNDVFFFFLLLVYQKKARPGEVDEKQVRVLKLTNSFLVRLLCCMSAVGGYPSVSVRVRNRHWFSRSI